MKTAVKIFKYTGKDSTNQLLSGEVLAKHLILAKAELVNRGIQVLTIQHAWWKNNIVLTDQLLLLFSQQLALLLKAHIPLAQALSLMQLQNHAALQGVIITLRSSITQGSSLSNALEASGYFTAYYCAMIRAGEQTGQLEKVLFALTLEQEQLLNFQHKIKKALAYPVCIVLVAFLLVILLLLFVVPQFKILFSDNMASLPAITRGLFAGSDWLNRVGLSQLCGFIIVVSLLGILIKRTVHWKKYGLRFLFTLPMLGNLCKNICVSRYLRTLHLSCTASLPILQGLTLSAQTSKITLLLSTRIDIVQFVTQGKSLHSALTESHLFSPWILHLINLGETSGQLSEMLAQCVSIIERDIDTTTYRLTTFLEPMIMIILGIVLGTFIIALYLPIFQMGALY